MLSRAAEEMKSVATPPRQLRLCQSFCSAKSTPGQRHVIAIGWLITVYTARRLNFTIDYERVIFEAARRLIAFAMLSIYRR